ncbi:hypothetical protein [Streptosporangium roseum]
MNTILVIEVGWLISGPSGHRVGQQSGVDPVGKIDHDALGRHAERAVS